MITRRLAATILSLAACSDASFEDDQDVAATPAPAPLQSTVTLPAELESTVLAALRSSKGDALVTRSSVDKLGKTHVRVRQLVKGIPVWEGEAIVHVDPDGTTVTDNREVDVDVDTTPRVTKERAEAIARDACAQCTLRSAPDLWVVREGRARLAWRVQLVGVHDGANVMPIVFVDAHDGFVVRSWDNVQHVTGETQYNGLQTIPALYHNSRYYLEDNEYNLGVYDLNGNTNPDTQGYGRLYSTDTTFQRGDVAQAMFSVRNVAQYFWGAHEHWNPDGVGGPGKVSAVDQSGRQRLSAFMDAQFVDNSGAIYGANAAWWNGMMLLGQGDDATGDWTSLDIVGHEFAHGVIEYTAGLVYMNESGALNESFADVFGAMAERYRVGETANTWRIGEQVYDNGNPLRTMDNPTADGTSPDHYSNLLVVSWDRGGVHFNSGIGNKAFHLVAEGGPHRLGGSMYGIGADRAAEIWYHALANYMTEGSKFIDARSATQNAARDLFGYHSAEWNAVSNAWALVGVGIVSNDVFLNGSFESDSSWTFSGRAFTSTGYPQSGTRYLVMGGLTSQTGTATQDFAIDPLARTATISYYVNVTSGDASTVATDKLTIDILDADTGAFIGRAGTWSNLNRTSSAGVYTASGALNISHLRGRTIRLKLHATNDGANATTFRVDTVQVATSR